MGNIVDRSNHADTLGITVLVVTEPVLLALIGVVRLKLEIVGPIEALHILEGSVHHSTFAAQVAPLATSAVHKLLL